MEIKPIRNETDYAAALQEIEVLFNCAPDTPEADRLDVLVALVESYEAQHYRIPAPDPIEAIEHDYELESPPGRAGSYPSATGAAGLVLRETPEELETPDTT